MTTAEKNSIFERYEGMRANGAHTKERGKRNLQSKQTLSAKF